jgi:RNA polymerase sigma-70 factor, ECF subfamily
VTGAVEAAVTRAFREQWGQIVATLIGLTDDWDLAEECAQDAFAQALQRWPRDGIPRRPGAWLTTTARNRAIDRLRREAVGAAKLREAARLSVPDGPGDDEAADSGVPDDRLRLMFTCCHPALAFEAQVALTLRTLAGLTTAEIARAFLVSEDTMSKRLVRAKRKIRNAGIPFRVPPAHLLGERTASVLGVLYLLFNEGYAASAGAELVRQNLTAEAIRLARVLAHLLPDEPEAGGLLALLLLHDARRATRIDAAGELVALEDQDRGAGTPARSPRACGCWRRPCGGDGPARTRSRPPSPPATRPRPRLPTRTGRRSPRSTSSWRGWRPPRWCG